MVVDLCFIKWRYMELIVGVANLVMQVIFLIGLIWTITRVNRLETEFRNCACSSNENHDKL